MFNSFFSNQMIGLYDLSINPPSTNFLEFLIYLEISRQLKKRNNFEVIIYDNLKFLKKEKKFDNEKMFSYKRRCFDICINSLQLFDKIEKFTLLTGRFKKKFNSNLIYYDVSIHQKFMFDEYNKLSNPIFNFDKSSYAVFSNLCSQNQIDPSRVVTLTVRNINFDKRRNFDLEQIYRIYDFLINKNFFPIIIDDIEGSTKNNNNKSYLFCDLASSSWLNKFIFYSNAKLNIFSGNIPQYICQFGELNYIFIRKEPQNTFLTKDVLNKSLKFKLFNKEKIFRKIIYNENYFSEIKKSIEEFINIF